MLCYVMLSRKYGTIPSHLTTIEFYETYSPQDTASTTAVAEVAVAICLLTPYSRPGTRRVSANYHNAN